VTAAPRSPAGDTEWRCPVGAGTLLSAREVDVTTHRRQRIGDNASATTHRRQRIGDNASATTHRRTTHRRTTHRGQRIGDVCLAGLLALAVAGCGPEGRVERGSAALGQIEAPGPAAPIGDGETLLTDLLADRDGAAETRARVTVRNSHGLLQAVRGLHYPGTLRDWLEEWGELVGIADPERQLRTAERCRDGFECYEQVATDGAPIFGSYIQGRRDELDHLAMVLANVGIERGSSAQPITAEEARTAVWADADDRPDAEMEFGYAVIDAVAVPAWTVTWEEGQATVDARTGAILAQNSFTEHADSREIHRATPGVAAGDPLWTNWTLIWDNDPAYSASTPWPGSAALVHTYVGNVRAFFTWWGRDGWDDDPTSAVHRMRAAADVDYVPRPFSPPNVAPTYASWTHDEAPDNWYRASALFGTGAACLDVVGHEFFHGVEGSASHPDHAACISSDRCVSAS
jgi:hypothetical protein